MKKLIAAIVLALSLSAVTTGHTSEPLRRVPSELFQPVVIDNTYALSTLPPAIPTPSPPPTPKPTRQPDKAYAIVIGTASTYGYGYAGWLALPEGRGHRVRICGPAACIIRVSNDAGPDLEMQRAGRIVDLNAKDFNTICGCNWEVRGLLRNVRVEYLK